MHNTHTHTQRVTILRVRSEKEWEMCSQVFAIRSWHYGITFICTYRMYLYVIKCVAYITSQAARHNMRMLDGCHRNTPNTLGITSISYLTHVLSVCYVVVVVVVTDFFFRSSPLASAVVTTVLSV